MALPYGCNISNRVVDRNFFHCLYINGGSLLKYQIGYFPHRCPRRQYQILKWQQCKLNSNLKNLESFCGMYEGSPRSTRPNKENPKICKKIPLFLNAVFF